MRSRVESPSYFLAATAFAVAAACLSACAVPPEQNLPKPVSAASGQPITAEAIPPIDASVPAPADAASAPTHMALSTEAIAAAAANLIRRRNPVATASAEMLAYSDKTRAMLPAELAQEINRVSDASTPQMQMQLAIALSQTRQLPDLYRAQDQLQRLLQSQSPDAQPLFPLARLLASRLAEQRRVEDALERQSAQIRDQQRQINQNNEKLEALKAIERSLLHRQNSSSAPASGATPSASGASRSTP